MKWFVKQVEINCTISTEIFKAAISKMSCLLRKMNMQHVAFSDMQKRINGLEGTQERIIGD